jgi:heme exporter protein C
MPATHRLVPILLGAAAAMFAAAPYVIDTARQEATMGLVQRIFYFHFPSAMTMMLAALVCGGASAMYLFSRRPAADRVALASAELAVVFGALVLVTGPLWARKSWGTWWVWDARVTSTFIMWMVFNAYLLLRRFGGAGSEVLAAAVGFFGMALVPFIYWSVNLWRTIHPLTSVVPTLPTDMGIPLYFCWTAFTILFVALMLIRVRIERSRAELDAAYLALED